MTTQSQSDTQISDLRASLNGKVIGPDDPGTTTLRRVFFTGFDRRPAAIVRAADASDVARVVTLARETGAELAVRSGGHSRAGHGTSEGGIVLDLSAMNAVEIDADGRTAWAQTGVTAGDYTRATGEHGLATGLGDTASVGLGGITLGGGIGFLVRKHGLTIDDLLAAEVVTADGELLEVDERDSPRSLLGAPGRRRQLRCRDQAPAPAARDRPGRRRDAAAPCERRRDHRPGRRGGRGARGALHHREHHEGAAAALHPRRAARQARGDGPDGLRGRCRGRREGDRADPRPRHSARRHGSADPLPGDVSPGRKAHARRSPRERTCSSTSSPRERRRRSSRTSRPRPPRWPPSSCAFSAARWRASPTTRPRSATGGEAHGEHRRHVRARRGARGARGLGRQPGEGALRRSHGPRPTSGSSATRARTASAARTRPRPWSASPR